MVGWRSRERRGEHRSSESKARVAVRASVIGYSWKDIEVHTGENVARW